MTTRKVLRSDDNGMYPDYIVDQVLDAEGRWIDVEVVEDGDV